MFKQELILLVYNKDVICVIDKGHEPLCKTVERAERRNAPLVNLPSHDPYIPRSKAMFFKCSLLQCEPFQLQSLTQISSPDQELQSCFEQTPGNFTCETIRYSHLKDIDKVLFLSKNIRNKIFYMVDCLVYSDGGRVCHKKDNVDSHAKLVDTGTIARPGETGTLAQDEFICEENQEGELNCDVNSFVPFEAGSSGLKLKDSTKYDDNVLLKSESYLIQLTRACVGTWCGYNGRIAKLKTRRGNNPFGGRAYRCYYAKNQQVCKPEQGYDRNLNDEKGFLSSR